MTVAPSAIITERLLRRICGEYLEMPGLQLTRKQAQRLWGLDEDSCTQILERLVALSFLRRSGGGSYSRFADGAVGVMELLASIGYQMQSSDSH